ncbi:unnamed protein product [Prunus armeniaca]
MVKLDFPHFNGLEDPTRDAQLWFQLMKEETPITTWATFKQGLHDRYSPTQFQDFFGDLMKLQKLGSENIKTDVQACKPQTLSAAIGLARLYESRNKKTRRYLTSYVKQPCTNGVTKSDHRQNFIPIKRLFAVELKERKNKGLCYNCDEKFSLGHRCKKLFLIEDCWANEENDAKDADTHEVELGEEVFPEISLRAVYGG